MASKGTNSASRGQYASSGSTDEREMYIADVPAGSAQDNLRDLNRIGYRAPWTESPRPALEGGDTAGLGAAPAPQKVRRKGSLYDWAVYHARRDRKGFYACAALSCVIVLMIALWCGRIVDGVRLANDIQVREAEIELLNASNETLTRQLDAASSGENIRNIAQNELGMLRRERANQVTIYIRNDSEQNAAEQVVEEPRMELLDVLLGLLDVFHIGE